jgi:Domain of unknown function (DUF4388)
MERFKGNLATYRLQLLMPAFFQAPAVDGMLRVERASVRRHFFFRRGWLVGESSSEPMEHLGQVLARLGLLDATRAAAAFEAAETAAMPFGTVLVERGLVSKARLVEAMEHKTREALFDCYGWESGEVEFRPGLPPLGRAVELQLGLRELHRDALARLREWEVFWELFPGPDTTFQAYREFAVEKVAAAEEHLLQLAAKGATLSELLAAAPEGPLHGARWVLRLYRRGALTPRRREGPKVGEATRLAELLELARSLVEAGRYEEAVAVAAQVLERAPVPEAHALYREAEVRLTVALAEEVLELDGRLSFEPLPRPTPASLTADDLYLYTKLRGSRSVREVLRNAAMGELAAYRGLQRLMDAGVARVLPDTSAAPKRRTKTDPYGVPVYVPSPSGRGLG